jgi:hypothetical protein
VSQKAAVAAEANVLGITLPFRTLP